MMLIPKWGNYPGDGGGGITLVIDTQPAAGLLQTGSAQFAQCRSIRPQPISDDRIRSAVALHQFPENCQGGLAVSLLRDKGLQHLAFGVSGRPRL